MRINKYLALHLGLSRRASDDLVMRGKVMIDGSPATLGSQVEDSSKVTVDSQAVTHKDFMYLMLNKPTGYVSSRKSQGQSPTIYKLLPAEYHDLKPVGRLDRDSSGLLLLTNDGDYAHQMTHPSFQKTKVYKVRLNKDLEPLHQQMITDYGVKLEDGVSQFFLEKLGDNRTDWQVTMREGRNRQIRRTFAALGYNVTKLHRTHFGRYELLDLKSGQFKIVDRL